MNERIKELIEQSKSTKTSYFDGRGNVTQTYFDQEKFTALLITAVLAEVRDEVQYQSGWTLADIVTERVKKVFGVEE